MSKLKTLKEKRASIYSEIDELRKATDQQEMTSEEQQRWDALFADYEKADKAVEQEERFESVQRKQLEGRMAQNATNQANQNQEEEYRSAFTEYLLRGSNGINAEQVRMFESRAGLTGLSGGVIIPETLASTLEIALKTYGGMFEAGDAQRLLLLVC
ncbi:MAG: phage major capsid protein [Rikenellaceae bacterium]